MGLFDDFRKKRKPDEQGIGFEYYEDTHDESGEYVGPSYGSQSASFQPYHQGREQDLHSDALNRPSSQSFAGEKPFKMPDQNQSVTPRNYQNVVVYRPSAPEDVQTLIDFLKRREPAIVNLDDMEPASSQRILDFISGAIYALSGSVHRIAGNIFLLSPEGVEITVPYEPEPQNH